MSLCLANYHLEILVYKVPDRSARASKHRGERHATFGENHGVYQA
jgi:hypothetical protein